MDGCLIDEIILGTKYNLTAILFMLVDFFLNMPMMNLWGKFSFSQHIVELIVISKWCRCFADCRDYFGGSLFIVGEIGGNDYINMYVSRLSMTQVKSYASTIVQTIARTIKVC